MTSMGDLPADSADPVEQVIAAWLKSRFLDPNPPRAWAPKIAAALRDAGLLRSTRTAVPGQVVVDRDDLELGLRYLHGILTGQAYDVREVAVIYNELVAALSPDPSPPD